MVSTRSKSAGAPASARASTAAATRAAPRPAIVKKNARKPKPAKPAPAPDLAALPPRQLLNHAGALVKTTDYVSAAAPGLVLFTYPRANTPGCTTQALGLNALADEARAAGYVVVGASYDSPKTQAAWRAKRQLQIDLLCDTLDIGLLKALRAHKAPKGVKRSVFVFRRSSDRPDHVPVVLARHNISPKDSIAVITDYITDNPCNADHSNHAPVKDDHITTADHPNVPDKPTETDPAPLGHTEHKPMEHKPNSAHPNTDNPVEADLPDNKPSDPQKHA